MAMQKIEFEFPDEKVETTEIEIEDSSMSSPFEPPKEKEKPAPAKKDEDDDDLDLEIIDDTPAADRGRAPSEPPEDVTEEELGEYSAKVKKRLKHFSKGYHDERRAKEQAQRERDELERLARQIYDENQKLKQTVGTNRNVMLETAKKTIARDYAIAQQAYKAAYDAGDSDKLLKAQEALNKAQFRAEQLRTVQPQALQPPQDDVQQAQQVPHAEVRAPQAPARQPDKKAEDWAKKNSWFGQDQEMTALALGAHAKLVESGIDPTSDTYYEKLNARMQQVFPDYFGDDDETPQSGSQRRSQVVAPATRSTAPKKVKLTQTQVALAKRLGIPIEEYAKQVAIEMRKG
jgi:hypothetical protein